MKNEAIDRIIDIGLDIHVRQWRGGTRRPFLLVHGLASNARTWDLVGQMLTAAGHPVVAVDQRGHGLSEKPDEGYDFATVTADLSRLLDALEWERPYVAGQSWGGNVVLELAARYPERVAGLALVDGGYIDFQADPANTWERVSTNLRPPDLTGTRRDVFKARLQANQPDWKEEGIEATLANFETMEDGTIRPWLTLERHMKILRSLWEQRPPELYRHVGAPVLICAALHGNREWEQVKRRQVAAAQQGLPRVAVAWFPHTAHDIHIHRPVRLVNRFLDAIDSGFWP
jgi:pimeloyl-ACP methyl ester carboxylesterase